MAGKKEVIGYLILIIILFTMTFGSIYILRSIFKTEYPLMVVVSQSMVPTLGVGDFIFVEHVNDFEEIVASPEQGDIIVFTRGSSEDYIVHRAIQKYAEDGRWLFVTKGDNNLFPDGRAVPEENVVGKFAGRIPILGYFPLIIKTLKGFILIASLMAVIFFADDFFPVKKSNPDIEISGRFPWLSLLPFSISPLEILYFLFKPGAHLGLEMFALLSWYVGCIIAPLAFTDDDMCFMLWLYHLVLFVIPISCDISWWLTGITPSNWWYVQGSTVPISFLFLKETPAFNTVYTLLLLMIIPGVIAFFCIIIAKRRKIELFLKISSLLRSSKNSGYKNF